jgi:hypothetical protein
MRTALAAAAIIGAFTARSLLVRVVDNPTGPLVAFFAALLVVALAWPMPSAAGQPRAALPTSAVVVALGIAAFAVGRVIGGGHPPALTSRLMLASSLAAVAEEAFFRRVVFGLLLGGGTGLAVAGSAALFAAAHIGVYGFPVLPIDLAAGLVLSWQRWASGSWAAPALTHVLANVMVAV